jgi:Glycosyl hydrolases family 16
VQGHRRPIHYGDLWMIGYEDEPEHSAEICICEIFGRDVAAEGAMVVGMGLHPFGDPRISEEFGAERVAIYAREFHVYAVEWTPEHVAFSIDGEHVKRVGQSPSYPMQLMLSLYEFPEDDAWDRTITGAYPKEFVVDYVRGYRRVPG